MTDSTTTKLDNPNAFPSRRDVPNGLGTLRNDVPGMTLRDWFAGQVISDVFEMHHRNEAARMAYELADAMLAARSKGRADD